MLAAAPDFQNPPVYDFINNNGLIADLQVRYETPQVAGCSTHLRQFAGEKYDNRPVAPTMLMRPGLQYQANITNTLPDDESGHLAVRRKGGKALHHKLGSHGGQSTIFGYIPPENLSINHNEPGNFNVTNLHTHGWHVNPTENHDNIFAAIGPGDPTYLQQVDLPTDHVAGTFWYHAHVHGSTTIQVSSGMAGTLLVNDPNKGLDAIPEISSAVDRVMVFQQLAYDTNGEIENYSNLQQSGYKALNRPVFVNGQAYPVLEMRVDEVQRWRFIHAGITDGIQPQLVNDYQSTSPQVIPLHEIALDGLPTGTMPSIQKATLSPGYRVDVLAQISDASVGDTYYLVDASQTLANGNNVTNRYVLAQIKIVSGSANATTLPTTAQIAQAKQDYVYGHYEPGALDPYATIGPLNDVTPAELQTGKRQTVHFLAGNNYTCPDIGGSCTPCPASNPSCNPKRVYMTCDGKDGNDDWQCMNFNASADYVRSLTLDTASLWSVSGETNQNNHTFHIHVNPFQVQRKFVDGSTGGLGEEWVWKDTLRTPNSAGSVPPPAFLKSRYTVFTGAFVQHCHVLNHEDQGMMQVVEIRPSDADLIDNPKAAGEPVIQALQRR
ncbi:MAG: multicopper oxidase domain-containing protein [Xanthomonadales bacterium]|nr:multicopper oxidase domain-containing protein [Xanthomonadales bacterium]